TLSKEKNVTVFTGTFEACLEKFRGSDHINANRKLAAFCDVGNATVSRWGQYVIPRGKELNKAIFYLASMGFESTEYQALHPFCRYLGKLVAYDVITTAEAKGIINVNHDQYLWSVL